MLSTKVYKDYWKYIISGYDGTNDTALSTYNAYLMTANDVQIGNPVSFDIVEIIQSEINILFIPSQYQLVFTGGGDAAKIVIKQDTANFGEIDAFLVNFGEIVNFDGTLTVDFEYFGFLVVQNENSSVDVTEDIENIRISLMNKGVDINETTVLDNWPEKIDEAEFGTGLQIDGQVGISGVGDTLNINPGDTVIRVRELIEEENLSLIRDTKYDYMQATYDSVNYEILSSVVHYYEHTGIFFFGGEDTYEWSSNIDEPMVHFFTKNGNSFTPTVNQSDVNRISWLSPSRTYGAAYYYDSLNSSEIVQIVDMNNGVPLSSVSLPPIPDSSGELQRYNDGERVAISDDGNTVAYIYRTYEPAEIPQNSFSSFYYEYIKVFQRIDGVFIHTASIHNPLWWQETEHFEMDASGARILFQGKGYRTETSEEYVSPLYFVTLSNGIVTNFVEGPVAMVNDIEYYNEMSDKFSFGVNNQLVWLTNYDYNQSVEFAEPTVQVFEISSGNFTFNSLNPITVNSTITGTDRQYFTSNGNHLVFRIKVTDSFLSTYELKIHKKINSVWVLIGGDTVTTDIDIRYISSLVNGISFYYGYRYYISTINLTNEGNIQYQYKFKETNFNTSNSKGISISRNGQWKIIDTYSDSIKIWSDTGVNGIKPTNFRVAIDAFSNDNRKFAQIITTSGQEKLKVGNIGSGDVNPVEYYTFLGDPIAFADVIMDVSFSADSKYLYAIGKYGALFLYYINETNRTLQYIPNDFAIYSNGDGYTPLAYAINPQNSEAVCRISSGTSTNITFYDITNKEVFSLHSTFVLNFTPERLFYSPDGNYLVAHSNSTSGQQIQILSKHSGTWVDIPIVGLPSGTIYYGSSTFSFDSKYFLVGINNIDDEIPDIMILKLQPESVTLDSLHTLTDYGNVYCLDFDPKTYDLYVNNGNSLVRVYNTNSQIIIKKINPGDIIPEGTIDLGYAVSIGDSSLRMMSVAKEDNLYPTESELM